MLYMETEYLIRAILSLIFVVALIGIVAVVFQKFAIEKKFMSKGTNKKLRVLEYQMIDSKRRIAIVEYGNKEVLVLLGVNGETIIKKEDLHSIENLTKKPSAKARKKYTKKA